MELLKWKSMDLFTFGMTVSERCLNHNKEDFQNQYKYLYRNLKRVIDVQSCANFLSR